MYFQNLSTPMDDALCPVQQYSEAEMIWLHYPHSRLVSSLLVKPLRRYEAVLISASSFPLAKDSQCYCRLRLGLLSI
jgi:hypothetical protein